MTERKQTPPPADEAAAEGTDPIPEPAADGGRDGGREVDGDPPAEPVEGVDAAPPEKDEADDGARAEEAEARLEELSRQYVRLKADFDNFRRRTRAREADVRAQAAADVLEALLPVIDNLQLALAKQDAAADDGFLQGVALIEQQLVAVLRHHGLQAVEVLGRPFDPRTMEAVAQADGGEGAEPGHVLEELRRGYTLHDKVLRPAQVIVARES